MTTDLATNLKRFQADRAAREVARKAEAIAEYRAVLANPEGVTDEALNRLAEAIGITPDDVANDQKTLREIKRLEALDDESRIEPAERECKQARAAVHADMIKGITALFSEMEYQDIAFTIDGIHARLPRMRLSDKATALLRPADWVSRGAAADALVPNMRSSIHGARSDIAMLQRANPRLFGE